MEWLAPDKETDMNRRVVLGIVATLLVVGALAAVGIYAYSWGVAQGALQNTQIVVPEGGQGTVPVYPYGGPFYHFGPGFGYGRWGFGLGPLGCLFPLLGFFLLFALLRGLFWGGWGRRRWGGYGGGWGHHGPPPMFEEWHRRAHGEAPPAEQPKNE
jgi:hypothetical protein